MMISHALVELLLEDAPEIATLKAHRKTLTPEERTAVMSAKAVWHKGNGGDATPAVWKSIVRGKTWYVSNTHRCYQAKTTLKAAITAYHKFVKPSA